MAKKKPAASVQVDAHKHRADKRSNIPTRETAAFAKDNGAQPFLINRDRSLDPQLVWKGKDEQDAKPLEVPVVPIHVQEKIHPQAVVEDVQAWAKQGKPVCDLFADFNGLDDFAKKLEFYQHDQHWTNRLILGDSLLVMASLAEKERLRGQVQCIYFDPPYGIKFGSNWQVSTRKRDVKDAKAEDLTRQPEQIKAFRDTWELGIHSYLTYLRDRLAAARDMLTESGSIFVQIGDENVHLVRNLMDEVFGSENCVTTIPFAKTAGMADKFIGKIFDSILWYARDIGHLKYRQLFQEKEPGSSGALKYEHAVSPDGQLRMVTSFEGGFPANENWEIVSVDPITSQEYRPDTTVPFDHKGVTYHPGMGAHWKTSVEGLHRLAIVGRLVPQGAKLRYIRKLSDFPVFPLTNLWPDIGGVQSRSDPKIYVVQTSTTAIQRCILMTTDPGDLVLDPTCGSGTTAYVAEQWGRRWITIDTSRVALALARTRLMAARFPYYLLADSAEGRKRQVELTGTPPDSNAPPCQSDLHKGFVYRTVPHVTLKSIANNPDIKKGMSREQIDQAITRHAETETLYDQPYENKNIVRLTGPFTVESLSPHRSLPSAPAADETEITAPAPTANFGQMILDNLRKAGVKGTAKGQRITFARLDLFPGEYIQAEGESDTGTAVRVSIGPEFGTVGDADIKKAAWKP
jgi:adenine-specific DNA-methyltransferase